MLARGRLDNCGAAAHLYRWADRCWEGATLASLADFLAKNVEGYLLKDLDTLKVAAPATRPGPGWVGYPLLISAFAGIELLGALVSATRFDRNDGRKYFDSFWAGYVYKRDAVRAAVGLHIYDLARHGLAHAFVVKGDLDVYKSQPQLHLVRSATGGISIDAVQLANDFADVYWTNVKPLAASATGPVTQATMTDRLNEMEADYNRQASKVLASLSLPAAPTGPVAVASSSFGQASGAALPAPLTIIKSTP
jgi:hypothetical protein